MRIGVLTGGGDCPGLNAVLRAVTRKAERDLGFEVIGFLDGWDGVLNKRTMELSVETMRGTLPRGGTVLGASRSDPMLYEGGLELAVANLVELGCDALIVVGGDGTLTSAHRAHELGANIIGVPKTIDNDIALTEQTFGFNTAVQIATDLIDRLHTTAESHDRVMVVEVMGRHVGHVAVHAGIAGGATLTLIPEYPFDINEVCQHLVRRHERGRFASIVVVAEGAQPKDGTMPRPERVLDQWGHPKIGGIGELVGQAVTDRTGFESRVTVLGHVQRGGTPTAFDRVLCTRFGVAAVEAVVDGAFGQMVALRCDRIERVALSDVVVRTKPVDPDLYEGVARCFFA